TPRCGSILDPRFGCGLRGSGHAEACAAATVRYPTPYLRCRARLDIPARTSRRIAEYRSTLDLPAGTDTPVLGRAGGHRPLPEVGVPRRFAMPSRIRPTPRRYAPSGSLALPVCSPRVRETREAVGSRVWSPIAVVRAGSMFDHQSVSWSSPGSLESWAARVARAVPCTNESRAVRVCSISMSVSPIPSRARNSVSYFVEAPGPGTGRPVARSVIQGWAWQLAQFASAIAVTHSRQSAPSGIVTVS